MKRVLISVIALASFAAQAETWIPFGKPFTWNQCFYDHTDGVTVEPTITFEDLDIQLSTDGTEDATAGNDFTINDNGDCFDITMSAAMTTGAYIQVQFFDDDDLWFPFTKDFLTYGDVRSADASRGMASGVAQSGGATTIVLESGTNLADDILKNRVVCLTGGTGAGQCQLITAWDGDGGEAGADTATVGGWVTNPASGTEYTVFDVSQASLAEMGAYIDDTQNLPDADELTAALAGLATTDETDALSAEHADMPLLDELVGLIQLALRSDAAIGTDRSALLALINADEGSGAGSFDNTETALQGFRQMAIRDAFDYICTVSNAVTTPTESVIPCVITDREGSAVTTATGNLDGKSFEMISFTGDLDGEERFIQSSSLVSGELRVTIAPGLLNAPSNGDVAQIY